MNGSSAVRNAWVRSLLGRMGPVLVPLVTVLATVELGPVSRAAFAQSTVSLDSHLINPTLPSGASMGWRSDSMASDGDRVVLGAYGVQRAFVFERLPSGAWAMVAELAPPIDAPMFGVGVSIRGDEVAVGAPRASVSGLAEAGRVFAYRRNPAGEWQLTQTIDPESPTAIGWFGTSLALDGDFLAVGTGGNSPSAQRVCVYSRSQAGHWSLDATLLSPDAGVSDSASAPQFGFPVRLVGDFLLTADCNRDAPGATDAGRGYVFRRQDVGVWALEARLNHPEPSPEDGSVSIGGTGYIATNIALGPSMAVLSLGGDDSALGADQGSAHVFARAPDGTWSLQSSLVAPDGRAGDWMGWSSVRIVADELLVGSVGWDGADGSAAERGRVVRFRRDGAVWQSLSAIEDPLGLPGHRFGSGIAAGGGFICIAASWGDSGRGCGVVFGFGPDCDRNTIADPLDVVRGALDSNSNRVPDECECDSLPWSAACCIGNVNGDAVVDGADLGFLLNAWGACSPTCAEDLDRDGVVGGNDLGTLLAAWGPCSP